MSGRLYENAPLHVRRELEDAHREALDCIARAGTWWSASERVALVEERRRALQCALCAKRKHSLAPYGAQGSHEDLGAFDPSIVEVIHRIGTDPGRLTRSWFDGVIGNGMSPEAYVELVGVLAMGLIIDTLSQSLGLGLFELPPPASGEPSRAAEGESADDGAWVPIAKMQPQSRANIVRALGLVPTAQRSFWQLFRHHYLGAGEHAISEPQIELVAARTSALNQCFY